MKVVKTHTAPQGRDDLRVNATSALATAQTVTGMLVCGQIMTLLDDIDTLVEALEAEGVKVEWGGEEVAEPRLGSNLHPLNANVNWKKGG